MRKNFNDPPDFNSKQPAKKRVLLLGSGISKSISPAIHNKAFRELGLNIEYTLCEIAEKALDPKLDELFQDARVIGFNVTIPFKEKVVGRMTGLDPVALEIGAVNLVAISVDRRKIFGYNTDVDGVLASLSKLGLVGPSGQRAAILGSGGASRAVVFTLLIHGFDSVTILNRTAGRAEKLVLDYSHKFPSKKISHAKLTPVDLTSATKEADLLVNTLPADAVIPFQVEFSSTPKKMKFLDLNYRKNPPLLREAKKVGLLSIDGSLMLVEQAARSFEILTGISAPRKSMLMAAKRQTVRD